ncbi:response regulator [Candidatus Dojkabacteria bacterium]|uniref:Response regulator n=1 Tax=Candidatus Dojkabacteria bacterium TaxID=2099670 RepID=A0A955I7I6_9BACT|nr:response regulator [Candidatus Dojkabacteria bacterium]
MNTETNYTVLLVEDDDVLMRMYQEKLESEGYVVFTAADGAEGLEMIKQHLPAVVLSDIMMPGTNGLQMLEQKRALEDARVRDIPVIMLTNLGSQEYHDKAVELGAVDLFDKEDPSVVVTKLREFLSPASSQPTE